MSTLAQPYNIQNQAAVLAEGLELGDQVHVRVAGGQANDQMFFLSMIDSNEVVLAYGHVDGKQINLLWGDIVELWLLNEKPNRFHSDVPEVAEALARIKAQIPIYVKMDDAATVRYLLGQAKSARQAEFLFQQAREIIASVKA